MLKHMDNPLSHTTSRSYTPDRLPILYTNTQLPFQQPTVVAIGNFDGVHRGHQALLQRFLQEAAARHALPLLFTFEENPKVLLFGAKYLLGMAEKQEMLAAYGVEHVYLAQYGALCDMTCAEFVHKLLETWLNCSCVVVGSDFRFGAGRAGDCETMRQQMQAIGRDTVIVPPVLENDRAVSSTDIRRTLEEGDLSAAEQQMGHPLFYVLPVRLGNRLGRTLGFPTMNQYPPADRQLPKFGVYESEAAFDGRIYRGITNIGIKPTGSSDARPVLETHLLDCSEELYGVNVKVTLKRFLRKERCFASVEELRLQVLADIDIIKGVSS